jgi:hypothetical protein
MDPLLTPNGSILLVSLSLIVGGYHLFSLRFLEKIEGECSCFIFGSPFVDLAFWISLRRSI